MKLMMIPNYCMPINRWQLQKASRPPQDRTMVVASLAEVAQNMGAPISAYVDVTSLNAHASCI